MTVIDREMIEASSAINVAEVLRLVPGLQVTYAEGIEALSTYRGYADSYPRRMQVLIDGRSVYDPGLNGTVWSSIPLTLSQIEHIEVVRGSNAAIVQLQVHRKSRRSPDVPDVGIGIVDNAYQPQGTLTLDEEALPYPVESKEDVPRLHRRLATC